MFWVILLLSSVCLLPALSQHSAGFKADSDWDSFKNIYSRSYTTSQETYRKSVFAQNKQKVDAQNSKENDAKWAINKFADLTEEEFVATYTNKKLTAYRASTTNSTDIAVRGSSAPTTAASSASTAAAAANTTYTVVAVNWTALNKVTSVKDQGDCGSCYAFSALAALESLALIKNSSTWDLSEQQVVDCSSAYGNLGCNGGVEDWVYQYIIAKGGITTEALYPYSSATYNNGKSQTCKTNGGAFKVQSYTTIATGCQALITSLVKQPVPVGVCATKWSLYASGVMSATTCTSCDVNHAVLLVAQNSTVFNIKNSWGTSWGVKGFIYLALGNTCNICSYTKPIAALT